MQEPSFANDKSRSMRFLLRQKTRCRHGAGEYVFFFNRHPHSLQFCRCVATGFSAVVCEKKERDIVTDKIIYEINRSRYKIVFLVNDAIHVYQKSYFHRASLNLSKPLKGLRICFYIK